MVLCFSQFVILYVIQNNIFCYGFFLTMGDKLEVMMRCITPNEIIVYLVGK